MDSATNFEEIITCVICLETFNENSKSPRILPCGHSFCHSCLEKWLAKNLYCPTCKAGIRVNDAKSIPVNYAIKSLLNIRGQIGIALTSVRDPSEWLTNLGKHQSEGYCYEHDNLKEMRCMNCEQWICGLCASLQHKHCRTLLVVDAYKEWKTKVSKKIHKELGERKTISDRLNESLRILDDERKSIIEEITRKELELKDRKKRIEELETFKSEEKKFCHRLKQLQEMAETSTSDTELSKTINELDKLLEDGKKHIPKHLQNLHLPKTRSALETLCQNGPVYAVENRYGGIRYGKVAVIKGRILVSHFQQEKPDAKLYVFKDILSQFRESTELPRTAFLQLTPVGGWGNPCVIVIETIGNSRRAHNFILVCSTLKGSSYLGLEMKYLDMASGHQICPCPPFVVEGIRNDGFKTPLKDAGVYGVKDINSCFWIKLKDLPSLSYPKLGVVVSGLQNLKDHLGTFKVTDCGLVI